jgi:hypothetical protein
VVAGRGAGNSGAGERAGRYRGGMAQVSRRRGNEETADLTVGSGQRLWLESCIDCKRQLTIVAVSRPVEPRCEKCAAATPRE